MGLSITDLLVLTAGVLGAMLLFGAVMFARSESAYGRMATKRDH